MPWWFRSLSDDLGEGGDEAVDVVGRGVGREPDAHAAAVAEAQVAGALDGVEVPGRCVDAALGEPPTDLLRVATRHREEQGGRARAGVAVHGDAGQRPQRGLELVEQRPLVGVHRLHPQLDPLAPAGGRATVLAADAGAVRCGSAPSARLAMKSTAAVVPAISS